MYTREQHLIVAREMYTGTNEIRHGDTDDLFLRFQIPQSDIIFTACCKRLRVIAATANFVITVLSLSLSFLSFISREVRYSLTAEMRRRIRS